ncbi:MAG: phospholipid carrier-dependent glycosyltransferase [Pseudohongiellaceae bacterium]
MPHFFGVKAGGYDPRNSLWDNIGYATVWGGDEPHYMTMASSIINDGDMDLKNNYASSLRNGFDSGIRFRPVNGMLIDHHTFFDIPEGYRIWDLLVKKDEAGNYLWLTNAAGDRYTFSYEAGYEHLADLPEYSWHPPFLAVIGYPFLRWFKNSPLLEPATLFLSYLATLLAAAFAYWALGSITQSVLVRFTAIAVIFLASPVWHYSRTIFTEPFIAAFFICAYACYWRGKSVNTKHLATSLFIGLAMLMKPFAGIVMLPMFYLALRDKNWRGMMALCVGPALGACAVLYWHYLITGNPFSTPGTAISSVGFSLSVVLPNIRDIFISDHRGILLYCPALIPAAYGWWQLFKEHGKQASVALFMALPYMMFFATFTGHVAYAYGPRYMTVILPLLLVGIIGFLAYARLPRILRLGMWGLLAASFLINASAAIGSWKFWVHHPVQALLL